MMMEHFGNEFTTIFYLIDVANSGKLMIRVVIEDTALFAWLVCWVYWEEVECKIQLELMDMTLLGILQCR